MYIMKLSFCYCRPLPEESLGIHQVQNALGNVEEPLTDLFTDPLVWYARENTAYTEISATHIACNDMAVIGHPPSY